MRTKVQRWGNSLALRIPKSFAEESKLDHNSDVNISVHKGKIIISPVEKPAYTLDELLAGINKENIHKEIDSGNPVGKEVW